MVPSTRSNASYDGYKSASIKHLVGADYTIPETEAWNRPADDQSYELKFQEDYLSSGFVECQIRCWGYNFIEAELIYK